MICVHQCKELSFHFATGFSWHMYEDMSLTLNDVFRDPSNEAAGATAATFCAISAQWLSSESHRLRPHGPAVAISHESLRRSKH